MPEAGTIRSEEFINAFNYHDPEAAAGAPLAFAWETARSPFAHNRDLIRFSVKTAAQGRQPGRPLNIVVLLDNSGSMERADRARIIQNAFRVLATQLQAQDRLSIVLFARTAQLWVDGATGDQAANLVEGIKSLVPQGGTNLEDAMNLAYQTAVRHFAATGVNRVVLLTDGAANLGDVEPTALKEKVESFRKQGIALDCFGIGWEGYNDELMETLSRNGDGRYGFLNTPKKLNPISLPSWREPCVLPPRTSKSRSSSIRNASTSTAKSAMPNISSRKNNSGTTPSMLQKSVRRSRATLCTRSK
jgi:Mg-chelatase subunit ChlD